jgi:hypothetical protein
MEHNPSSEANSSSDSQEIPRLLWNLKVHYRVHKSLPTVLVSTQNNSAHTFPPFYFKFYFNIIL